MAAVGYTRSRAAGPRRWGLERSLAWALAWALASCEREPARPRRRYVTAPEVDAAAPADAPAGRLCALRATPAEDVAVGAGVARVSVAWGAGSYGVAWREAVAGDAWVAFARVSAAGALDGGPARVTERGFRAGAPSVAWNGAGWSVVFDGAYGEGAAEVYQARVDPRGRVAAAPWRMTRSPRDDVAPAFASNGRGFALAWVGREGGRHVLYGQVLDRWDAPVGLAVRLLDTSLTLAAPAVTWSGQEWAFTCVSARRDREVLAVDFARLDATGAPRGARQHASPDRIGGVDTDGRYAIAWDGAAYGVAWSELREGATRVFARRVSARGNALGGDVRASDEGAASASEPALARVADGVLAVAMRVERDGLPRVWVRTLDAAGNLQRGHVELQGADGLAGAPAMAFDGEALGVATATARGVAFHRVTVGPCVTP